MKTKMVRITRHATAPVDTSEWNREVYESDAAVRKYAARAIEGDLLGQERKLFDRYFSDPDGASVLDLGCGVGRTTRLLAEEGFDVVGVDVSEKMIREAEARFPSLDFRVADAKDLDFPTETFDYALFSQCGLDYLHPERNRFLALLEVRRVLKPGGIFAFSSHNSLYLLPSLFFGTGYFRQFYWSQRNVRRLFRRYKFDEREYGAKTYVASPLRQYYQLCKTGFEFVEYVAKRETPLRYFEIQPYYVVRKPRAATRPDGLAGNRSDSA